MYIHSFPLQMVSFLSVSTSGSYVQTHYVHSQKTTILKCFNDVKLQLFSYIFNYMILQIISQVLGCPKYDVPTHHTVAKHYCVNVKHFNLNLLLWVG